MRHSAIVLAIALALIAGQAAAAPVDLGNRLPGRTPGTTPSPSPSTQSVMGGGDQFATATTITALPYTDTGSTSSFNDNYTPPCASSGAPDVVYRFKPTADVCVTITLCGANFNTALHLYDASPSYLVACNDDYCGNPPLQSKLVSVPLLADHWYYIVVDGYGCDFWTGVCDRGDYTISVTADCPAPCSPACPPGAIAEGEPCGARLNEGCNQVPQQFTDIPASPTGVTVCGTFGNFFDSYGTWYRDTDWYRITLTERSHVRLCATGGATTLIAMVDGRTTCSTTALVSTFVEYCQEGCLEADLDIGTYYMYVASIFDITMACDRSYVMTVTCTEISGTPMGSLHCNDANGNTLFLGQTFTVTGVLTSNFPISTGSRFTIQDGTGGIMVFGAPIYCGGLGDLVTATGKIIQYNGVLELSSPLSITLVSSGHPQPVPLVLTLAEVNGSFGADYCEPNESRLVQVRSVVIRSSTGAALPPGATFAAGTNYQMVAMDGTIATLRVVQTTPNGCSMVNPLIGTPIPLDCPVHVTGVLSQSDSSSPYTAGYQVQPRGPDDIAVACPVPTVPITWGSIKSRYR
jgi:hypothetical protein